MVHRSKLVSGWSWPRTLFAIGVFLRVITFLSIAPDDVDAHSEMIKYILEFRVLPPPTLFHEAFQPPLYYFLAAPLFAATGHAKGAQVLSLAFSLLTLFIMYRLIFRMGLIKHRLAGLYCFLLVALLPQFVIFSVLVSNDTLTILLGAICVLQIYRYAAKPDFRELAILAVIVGAGLLTKATFLAYVPAAAILVIACSFRLTARVVAAQLAAFLLIVPMVGVFNFVRNYRATGRVMYNNMDPQPAPPWVQDQRQSDRGWRSFTDVNVVRLIRSPLVLKQTAGAYPVMLYGSFGFPTLPSQALAGEKPLWRLSDLSSICSRPRLPQFFSRASSVFCDGVSRKLPQ